MAEAEDLSGLFNQAVIYASPSEEIFLNIHSDNTFRAWHTKDGSTREIRGTWVIDGSNVCFNETPDASAVCRPNLLGKVRGDQWTETGTDGGEVQVKAVRNM